MRRRDILAGAAASLTTLRKGRAGPMMLGQPAGAWDAPYGPGPIGAGPSLDLSFLTGTLDPRITFARASTATYFDATGTLQTATANTPRFDYGPTPGATPLGLLIEEGRTNSLTNPRAEGAVPGTPGTMPTNWAMGNGAGLSNAVVGSGSEGGVPYVDVRFFGTSTAGDFLSVILDTTASVPATSGQIWTLSVYLRLIGGTFTGLNNLSLDLSEFSAAGVNLGDDNSPIASVPTNARLGTQRSSVAVTMRQATVATIRNVKFQMNCTNATAIDVTLRIGGPQLELSKFATSVILPPVGAPAASTRAADSATFAAPVGYTGVAMSWAADYIMEGITVAWVSNIIASATADVVPIFCDTPSLHGGSWDGVGYIVTDNAGTIGTVTRVATAYRNPAAGADIALNGNAASQVGSPLTNGFAGIATFKLMGDFTGSKGSDGWIRRVRYWPRLLAVGELVAATT